MRRLLESDLVGLRANADFDFGYCLVGIRCRLGTERSFDGNSTSPSTAPKFSVEGSLDCERSGNRRSFYVARERSESSDDCGKSRGSDSFCKSDLQRLPLYSYLQMARSGTTQLPRMRLSRRLTLDELNLCLQSSRYVDTVILMNNGTDNRRRFARHFRVAVVVPVIPPPNPFPFAIMEGDFFVDRNDSSQVWKLQHFGYQNLLDPALDGWMEINRFSDTPGEVTLPLRVSVSTV